MIVVHIMPGDSDGEDMGKRLRREDRQRAMDDATPWRFPGVTAESPEPSRGQLKPWPRRRGRSSSR